MINIYERFYNLSADPFRLSADYHFSYAHDGYKKALAYLNFALYSEEGFIVITGRPGTGKTTLINDLISRLDISVVTTANLVTTQIEAKDLLHLIASSFGLETDANLKSNVLVVLENFLKKNHSAGKRALLIVDEAQCLKFDALEELRLLSNIHSDGKQLLQIFLVGQEEFREHINAADLEQLRQRIIGATHLNPLTDEETVQYVIHRLYTAGWKNNPRITKGAVLLIHHFSGGIPRIINLICSRLLIYGCMEEKHNLDTNDMLTVLEDLKNELLILDDDIPFMEVVEKLQVSDNEYLEPPSIEEPEDLEPPPIEESGDTEKSLDNLLLAEDIVRPDNELEGIINFADASEYMETIEHLLAEESYESLPVISKTDTESLEGATRQSPINESGLFMPIEEIQINTDESQDRFRHFVDQLAPTTSDHGNFSVFGMRFRKVFGLAFLLCLLIAILVNVKDGNLYSRVQEAINSTIQTNNWE